MLINAQYGCHIAGWNPSLRRDGVALSSLQEVAHLEFDLTPPTEMKFSYLMKTV